MSLRAGLRAYLAADATYMALLTGGLYPDPALTPPDQAEITRDGTPAAFDSFGDVRPAGMVVDDGAAPFGPYRDSAQSIVRLLHWQQSGRGTIEAADQRAYALLRAARLLIDGHYCTFRWAGNAQSTLSDPSLRDAALSWSRWQVTRLLA
jgi:hypothetical protein